MLGWNDFECSSTQPLLQKWFDNQFFLSNPRFRFHLKKFVETEIFPEKIAIAGSDSDIDWETLKNQTLSLSVQFKNLGIPKGHPIIIYGHKEYLFPLAMLACIHSNIPYIPIDKIYPGDRIRKIIATTGSQVLINCSDENLNTFTAITINSKFESTNHFIPYF